MRSIQVLKDMCPSLYSEADPAHDLSHIMRVFELCERMGPAEGADMEVLLAAALLHDVGCTPKHLGRDADSEGRSLRIAADVLAKVNMVETDRRRVLACIEAHGFSKAKDPPSLEGAILQDADRLDAMGAIGIARTFLVSGATGRPIYDVEDPLAVKRQVDDKRFGLDHFERKLLLLKDGMHTASAKVLAEGRHMYLLGFRDQLIAELKGRL